MKVLLKRAYEPASPKDGARFLVDRLWPRDVKKEARALAIWLKEVVPSNDLRRWFDHEPGTVGGFSRRYRNELAANPASVQPLRDAFRKGTVTLVYVARDGTCNHAIVLQKHLLKTTRSLRANKHATTLKALIRSGRFLN